MNKAVQTLIIALVIATALFNLGPLFTESSLAQESDNGNVSIAQQAFQQKSNLSNASIVQHTAPQEEAVSQVPYLDIPYYLVTIIAIALILPLIIDQLHSYRNARLLSEKGQKTRGTPAPMAGLYRALMTFGVILLIGAIALSLLGLVTSSVLIYYYREQ